MNQHALPPTEIARQLVVQGTQREQHADELLGTAETLYGQLHARMAPLLGQAGFDALWARALHQVQPGVQTIPALIDNHHLAATRERIIAVFGNCFALLYIFIGTDLTLRLIQQTWPSLSFVDPTEREEEAKQ
jgi:hypothetical protein